MRIIILALIAVCCTARRHEFYYPLLQGPDPSVFSRMDSMYGCPPRGDTIWTHNRHTRIPLHWLEASLKPGCAYSSLPLSVRRRLREDPESLSYYEKVLTGSIAMPEAAKVWALLHLSWSGDARYAPLILAAARSGPPGLLPSGDYNLEYRAVIELAPYVSKSSDVREVVLRAAQDQRSEYARRAGVIALAVANTPWSRNILAELPPDDFTRDMVARALASQPCSGRTIFVEAFGIEGQNYSRCKQPPDYR
jgi:hypothetical protein